LQLQTAELSPALPILPGLGPIDDGVDWAFRDAEIGEASPVLENEQAYYVLELVSRRDEGTLSLQEATPTIRTILMRQAKIQRARERLADAERQARAGEPLEPIAAAWQASVEEAGPFTRSGFVPGIGRMNAAVGAAFGLRPGATSPLIEADLQLFLIRTVARQDASRTEWQAQVAEQRARVLQALGDTRWNQFMLALRETANIVDNRSEIMTTRTGTVPGR
jgi:peptidyl-prolyl cis-trans isomerase D